VKKVQGKKLDKRQWKERTKNQDSVTWIASFYSLLSNASSLLIHQSFKSLFTDFSHVKFGCHLSLFLLPIRLITPLWIGTSMDIRCICPNHLKRCCMSFSSTGVTLSLSRISSFRIRSLLVWPQIHCSMRISATLSCWACRILVSQHFSTYNMTDRIAVLYNLSFSFSGTLWSHKTPGIWCHFNQSALILWLTSSSISPFFWSIDPN
jgi:hypothetical protein